MLNSKAPISTRNKKRQVLPAATAPASQKVTVGSGLPRQIRARLGLMQSGTRKRTSSKLSAANVGKEPRGGAEHDFDIPPIRQSDNHVSPFSMPKDMRAASPAPGTDRSMVTSSSRKDERPKRFLKEKNAPLPRPWNAKVDARGRSNNQQPQPRGTTHLRRAHQRTEVREELRRVNK